LLESSRTNEDDDDNNDDNDDDCDDFRCRCRVGGLASTKVDQLVKDLPL
jgi:hypothetical protein